MRENLTTIEWPETFLGCPLRAGYQMEVNERFLQSEQVNGPTQYRAEKVEERSIHDLSFLWTIDQIRIYESFVETTLLGGMRWFKMKLVRLRYCHLMDAATISPMNNSVTLYTVSLKVMSYGKVRKP